MRVFQLRYNPVIKRPVIFKFQRTDRMGNSLNRVFYRMRVIIHRIDTPFIPCILVGKVRHTVQDRITHIDVRRGHVDFRTQGFLTVRVLSFLHLLKQPQILLLTYLNMHMLMPLPQGVGVVNPGEYPFQRILADQIFFFHI